MGQTPGGADSRGDLPCSAPPSAHRRPTSRPDVEGLTAAHGCLVPPDPNPAHSRAVCGAGETGGHTLASPCWPRRRRAVRHHGRDRPSACVKARVVSLRTSASPFGWPSSDLGGPGLRQPSALPVTRTCSGPMNWVSRGPARRARAEDNGERHHQHRRLPMSTVVRPSVITGEVDKPPRCPRRRRPRRPRSRALTENFQTTPFSGADLLGWLRTFSEVVRMGVSAEAAKWRPLASAGRDCVASPSAALDTVSHKSRPHGAAMPARALPSASVLTTQLQQTGRRRAPPRGLSTKRRPRSRCTRARCEGYGGCRRAAHRTCGRRST